MTLDVTEAVRERLDRLKERSGATSITEVIRRSLALYEVALDATEAGASLVVETPSGERRQVVIA